LRNQPVNEKGFELQTVEILDFYLADLTFFFNMWLFIVLALNALIGCHVWLAEGKLKEGECEG